VGEVSVIWWDRKRGSMSEGGGALRVELGSSGAAGVVRVPWHSMINW
jgi:hypothetical protein